MSRTLALIASVALTLTGCSKEQGPAIARLRPGQKVIVASWNNGATTVKPPNQFPFDQDNPASQMPVLLTGDQAQVITDESPEFGRYRPVKIKVLSYSGPLPNGGLTGLVCTIPRHEIRATSTQE